VSRAGALPIVSGGACAAALMTAAAMLWPGAAAAESADLKQIEHELQKDRGRASELERQADDLRLEIQALTAESISAARSAQRQESEITTLEGRLSDLEAREADLVAQLEGRRRQLTGVVAALQRLALRPTETLALAPGNAVDTARSALLLRVAIPEVEARAATLREELVSLHAIRADIERRHDELRDATATLAGERDRLRGLLDRKAALREKATAESEALRARAAKLAGQAQTLRELMQSFEKHARDAEAARAAIPEPPAESPAETPAEAPTSGTAAEAEAPDAGTAESEPAQTQVALARPDNIRAFPHNRASLRMPAVGRIIGRYGQASGDADTSKGIVIAARPLAQVVAPYDGQVVYAGPFRSYGLILIIEHGGRYHTLLAGLDRIDAVVGQWVLAGEPVGVLGPSQNGMAELYLELRRAGQPINPLPWLATTGDKVQG